MTIVRWVAWVSVAVLASCATPQKTEMVACPEAGCPSLQPVPPVIEELHGVAAAELQCPIEAIKFTEIGPQNALRWGPWEAIGCGKQTIYGYSGRVVRTALIETAAR